MRPVFILFSKKVIILPESESKEHAMRAIESAFDLGYFWHEGKSYKMDDVDKCLIA